MYTFLLQDWITIRGAPTIAAINQSPERWLDLSSFQDIVGWLDVKNFTISGGATIVLMYQSSPTADDLIFTAVQFSEGTGHSINTTGLSVSVMPNGGSSTPTPISRWLRWRLSISGGPPTANWDVTFRIFISANAGARGRRGMQGMAVPPSARAGMPVGMGAPGSIRSGTSFPAAAAGRAGTSPIASSFRAQPYGGGMASVPLHLRDGALSAARNRRS